MPTVKWAAAPINRGTVLTTELDNLGDGLRGDAGTEIDNSVNLDKFGVLELDAILPTPSANLPLVNFYLVKAIDGAQYADGSSTADPGFETKLTEISVRAVATAQNKQSIIFELPPCKFKIIPENKTGVAFPASGSTVTLYTMNTGSI